MISLQKGRLYLQGWRITVPTGGISNTARRFEQPSDYSYQYSSHHLDSMLKKLIQPLQKQTSMWRKSDLNSLIGWSG